MHYDEKPHITFTNKQIITYWLLIYIFAIIQLAVYQIIILTDTEYNHVFQTFVKK
jgi:hypothetical protein